MDPVSLNYSTNRDIWSSNSAKYFQPVKMRPSSYAEYSKPDIMSNDDMSDVTGHRSRLHSIPVDGRIEQNVSKLKLDMVDDVFSNGTTASGLVPLSACLSNNCELSPFPATQPVSAVQVLMLLLCSL